MKNPLPERSDERARSETREQYEPAVGQRQWSSRDHKPEAASDAKNGPEPGENPACPRGDFAPGDALGFGGTGAQEQDEAWSQIRVTRVT